jgi:hypothetical protein
MPLLSAERAGNILGKCKEIGGLYVTGELSFSSWKVLVFVFIVIKNKIFEPVTLIAYSLF